MLFDPDGLRAVKVSRERSFTGVLRRILDVRDQQCTDPYCDEPPHRCQGDHIIPYSQGGMTSQDNGQLSCGHHNRRNYKHRRPPPDP
jgi:5-methylcytosine-specific restriction endonuclease McrA